MVTLFPTSARRPLVDVVERLDLDTGDTTAKRSGFWIMLTLSALIAVGGVLTDSTATVIGAMIVAPLATPILGIALGVVTGKGGLIGRSILYVAGGVLLVVTVGALFGYLLPNPDLVGNSQVTGRTSPRLMDLVTAVATGFAGSVAITRKDLGDVLPGVAIAISLVPPLGVVGVCLGTGEPSLAFGAFVLFLSNMIALVLACTIVLASAGYARDAAAVSRNGLHRAYAAIGTALALVVIPMAANSAAVAIAARWTAQVQEATEAWLAQTPGATVEGITFQGADVQVLVRSPQDLPPVATLQTAVDQILGIDGKVYVVHTVGERLDDES